MSCPINRNSCNGCMYDIDSCHHPNYVEDTNITIGKIAKIHNIIPLKVGDEIKRYVHAITCTLVLDRYLNFLRTTTTEWPIPNNLHKLLGIVRKSKSRINIPELKATPYLVCEALRSTNFRQFCKVYPSASYLIEDIVDIDFSMAQRIRMAMQPIKGND